MTLLCDRLEKDNNSVSADYMQLALGCLPVLNQIISQYGKISLSEYVQTFVPAAESYQKRKDLYAEIYAYIEPLLGETVARRAVHDIRAYPVVLTMNHHGIDYCVSSVNGSIIYSLNAVNGFTPVSTVPVFSFGNIPLNNFTYPRGILLHQADDGDWENIPQKVPVFPDRLKNTMVSAAPPFDLQMICNAKSRLTKMRHAKQIAPEVETLLHRMLSEDYGDDRVLSQPSYSHQSVIVNNRIWKRLFPQVPEIPELLYIEIEKITATLLEYDLFNEESLAWKILFDPEIRESVLSHLDDISGCWNLENLRKRLSGQTPLQSAEKSGTVFFWGIGSSGKRIPLYLQSDLTHPALIGTDDRGKTRKFDFSPQSVIFYLKSRCLLPSLFTCFMVNSFARGLACIGGYYQCDYLPAMQKGVVSAFENAGCRDIADSVAKIPTKYYLCGMLTIMQKIDNKLLIPAGPVEIIRRGGISDNHLRQIMSLSVEDAHRAGLFDTMPDAVPAKDRPPGWRRQLAEDCLKISDQKIVVI